MANRSRLIHGSARHRVGGVGASVSSSSKRGHSSHYSIAAIGEHLALHLGMASDPVHGLQCHDLLHSCQLASHHPDRPRLAACPSRFYARRSATRDSHPWADSRDRHAAHAGSVAGGRVRKSDVCGITSRAHLLARPGCGLGLRCWVSEAEQA
jgi:hypothetical protein